MKFVQITEWYLTRKTIKNNDKVVLSFPTPFRGDSSLEYHDYDIYTAKVRKGSQIKFKSHSGDIITFNDDTLFYKVRLEEEDDENNITDELIMNEFLRIAKFIYHRALHSPKIKYYGKS